MEERMTRELRLDELFRLLDGTESPDDCYAILKTAWDEGARTADAALRAALARVEKERGQLKKEVEIGVQLTGSFFEALKPLNLTGIYVENPGQHITDLIQQLAAMEKELDELRNNRIDYGWWTKKDVPSQDAQSIIKRWEERWYDAQKYDVNQPMPSFYWVAHQTRCACLLPATEYERNVAYTMMVNKIEYELMVLKWRAAQARIAELEEYVKYGGPRI